MNLDLREKLYLFFLGSLLSLTLDSLLDSHLVMKASTQKLT